jgi:hypothetical protein
MVDLDAEFETVLKEQKRRSWSLLAGIRALPATT